MRKVKEVVEDELMEEVEDPGIRASFSGDFEIFSDEDAEPADRRRDPLRKYPGFDSPE